MRISSEAGAPNVSEGVIRSGARRFLVSKHRHAARSLAVSIRVVAVSL